MLERRDLICTYREPVIWGTVIVISLLGLVAGWLLGMGVDPAPGPRADATQHFVEGLDEVIDGPTAAQRIADAADEPEALLAIAIQLHLFGDADERADALAAWPTTGDGAIPTIGPALIPHEDAAPPPSLAALADAEPPTRWANRALAEQAMAHGDPDAALPRYAREGGTFPAADTARRSAIALALGRDRHDLLASWQAEPAWRDAFDARTHLQIAEAADDWRGILRWQLPALYTDTNPIMAVIAAVAAAVWLFFLWHASYGEARRAELGLLCALGFGLGVVSTWLTLLAITAQNQIGWDLDDGSAFGQAMDAILGIGLREELIKLLCVLPLAPWLLRRHSQLGWLLVASCVGAGFAAQENQLYFQHGQGMLPGRFLTANFLHVALTGMVGLAACQALRWPRRMAQHFGVTFLLAVIAHGLYDAFMLVQVIVEAGFSWGFLIVYVMTGNAYFAILAQERSGSRPNVSLTMTFCAGLALAIAVAMALLSTRVGLGGAIDLLIPGFLGTAVVIVMFVRGIGDRLSR